MRTRRSKKVKEVKGEALVLRSTYTSTAPFPQATSIGLNFQEIPVFFFFDRVSEKAHVQVRVAENARELGNPNREKMYI